MKNSNESVVNSELKSLSVEDKLKLLSEDDKIFLNNSIDEKLKASETKKL